MDYLVNIVHRIWILDNFNVYFLMVKIFLKIDHNQNICYACVYERNIMNVTILLLVYNYYPSRSTTNFFVNTRVY